MYFCEERQMYMQGDTNEDIASFIRAEQKREKEKLQLFFKFRGERQMREIPQVTWSSNPREMQSIERKKSLVNYSDKRGKRVIERETKERALKSWILNKGK